MKSRHFSSSFRFVMFSICLIICLTIFTHPASGFNVQINRNTFTNAEPYNDSGKSLAEVFPTPSPAPKPIDLSSVRFLDDQTQYPIPLQVDQGKEITKPANPVLQDWQEYLDEYWQFRIEVPKDWSIHNNPYIGLGFYVNDQDLELDPIGNPIEGAYFTVQVIPQGQKEWEEYQRELYAESTIESAIRIEEFGIYGFVIKGINENSYPFVDKILLKSGYIYRFQFLSNTKYDLSELIEVIYSSIRLLGNPVPYPYLEQPNNPAPNFDFTPIKLPFTYGAGKIISGYGHQQSPNQYAFDLCEGGSCTSSTLGQYIITPTNMKYDWSLDSDGNGSIDFHFFEIANDGTNKLCTQMGHFKLEITGLAQGTTIPQGAAIGSINAYPSSIAHIHMGLYTIPSVYNCSGDPTKRVGIPFITPYTLDGISYNIGENHEGKSVTSTNYPFCWMPTDAIPDPDIIPADTISSGCFPDSDTTPPTGTFISPTNGSTITNRVVNIAANASDNSGGSGVHEVRLSAVWPGSQWIGIGVDNSEPYSIDWDMCNSNVPDGDIELGLEVLDNEGNLYIYSQHYSNPHITKSYACGGGDPIGGDGIWNLNAWMNKYMAGYVNWSGTVTWTNYPYIYWDFGNGTPFDGWSGDEFSMRFWRNVYFPGGDYDIRAFSDDGVKVYIDNQIVIDTWWDHRGESGGSRYLSSGYHEVKVEYYENQGEAIINVFWYGPGYPRPDNNPPTGQIIEPEHLTALNYSPLKIYANATDDASGVDHVTFFAWYCLNDVCEWHNLSTDYSAPYEYDWNWSSIGDKHVWLDILVYDKTGKSNANSDGWVEVDLDMTTPFGLILSPISNRILMGNQIPISVYAIDGQTGIGSVQFFVGYDDGYGNYWKEIGWDKTLGDNLYRFTWDGKKLPVGKMVSFFVYAYDKSWNYIGDAVWNDFINGKQTFLPVLRK